jgi:hypothetical protein
MDVMVPSASASTQAARCSNPRSEERRKFGRQIRRGEDFVLLVHENPAVR